MSTASFLLVFPDGVGFNSLEGKFGWMAVVGTDAAEGTGVTVRHTGQMCLWSYKEACLPVCQEAVPHLLTSLHPCILMSILSHILASPHLCILASLLPPIPKSPHPCIPTALMLRAHQPL